MHSLHTASFILSCLLSSLASAGPAELAHPHDKPAGTRSLPGDILPPFHMLDAQGRLVPIPPEFEGKRAPPAIAPESTARGPSLAVALTAARAAIDDCASRHYLGGVAVVDSAGEARALLSADGADGSHAFVAQRKALTAVVFRAPSARVREMIAREPALLARVTPNMFVQFGAFPIVSKGEVIGAIGYSGGDDEACALAGVKAIQKLLE